MSGETMHTDNGNGFDDRGDSSDNNKSDKMFTLKKWNAVAMWSWDVECDTCAICRVQVMAKCIFRVLMLTIWFRRNQIVNMRTLKMHLADKEGETFVKDACLRCQAESSQGRSQDCVVVWGECNHSFHYCCMSLWVKQNNRCPLCQQEWSIQRMGK